VTTGTGRPPSTMRSRPPAIPCRYCRSGSSPSPAAAMEPTGPRQYGGRPCVTTLESRRHGRSRLP
jgi:hypothetical protein